jgi:S1-C subfamily serine protease
MNADENINHRAFVAALIKGSTIQFMTPEDANGVFENPKRKRTAVVSASDYDHDLAMLVVNDNDIPCGHSIITLANNNSVIGEEIYVMGHPAALNWSFAHGYMSAERKTFLPAGAHKGPWYQVDVAAWRGNSGGGVFNTNGELLGIASFLTPAPGHVMYVHLDSVRAFVQSQLLL